MVFDGDAADLQGMKSSVKSTLNPEHMGIRKRMPFLRDKKAASAALTSERLNKVKLFGARST